MTTMRDQVRLHESVLNQPETITPPKPRRTRRPAHRVTNPVKDGRVEPLVWGAALVLANYDPRRVEIVSYCEARVQ